LRSKATVRGLPPSSLGIIEGLMGMARRRAATKGALAGTDLSAASLGGLRAATSGLGTAARAVPQENGPRGGSGIPVVAAPAVAAAAAPPR
jgi:hypothetical protein